MRITSNLRRAVLRRPHRLPARLGLAVLVATLLAAALAPAAASASPAPASLGPGLGVSPTQISAAASATCAKVAYKAGFSYTRELGTAAGSVREVVIAVAVAMAESSCNPNAVFTNPGGCRDRGLWQIDDCAHPDVSDACAFQIQCNAAGAWRISNHGGTWTPWTTFDNGAWENFVPAARDAVSGFTVMLKGQGPGTCLDASKADAGNGGRIQQWTCSSADPYQQWTVSAVNGDNPTLRNVGAATCLDASKADSGNGGRIQQWTCSSGDAFQRWHVNGSGKLNTNGNAVAGLESTGAGTCLDASKADAGNGGRIQQWTCSSGDTFQQWN